MKKERIFKLILVLVVGIVLMSVSTNVFALTDSDEGLDFFEDTTDQLEPNDNTNNNTNSNTNTNNNANQNNNNTSTNEEQTPPANNYETNLPEAGLAENTVVGVAIFALIVIAIFAYKKVKEYRNI